MSCSNISTFWQITWKCRFWPLTTISDYDKILNLFSFDLGLWLENENVFNKLQNMFTESFADIIDKFTIDKAWYSRTHNVRTIMYRLVHLLRSPWSTYLCQLDAVESSQIFLLTQNLERTFDSDKLGDTYFTKFSKLTVCSADAGRCWLAWMLQLAPRHCTLSVLSVLKIL